MRAAPVEPEPEPFEVVGVVAMPGGFPPVTGGLPPPILLSSAYAVAHPDAAEVFAVRLRGGPGAVAAFQGVLDRLGGGDQVVATYQGEQTSVVQRSIEVDVTALRIVVALGGAAALLLVTQVLVRQTAAEAEQHEVLNVLGVSRRALLGAGLLRVGMIAGGAAAVAVVTASAVSALGPVGLARHADVGPVIEGGAAFLATGAASVLVSVATIGAVAVAWATRSAVTSRDAPVRRRSRGVETLARSGMAAIPMIGVRLALDSGRSRAGVRMAVAVATVGIAVVAAVPIFTTSLGHLLGEPQRYGWGWDAQIGDAFAPDLGAAATDLGRHPAVTELATGTVARLQIDALRVDTIAIEGVVGDLRPEVVDGRAPTELDEILLGGRTMRELGVELEDTVSVGDGGSARRMRIVGRGVLPEFAGAARFGEGASITFAGMRRIVPGAERDVVLLGLEPGADPRAVAASDPSVAGANLYLPTKPSDLADIERVGGTPTILAGLFGVLAIGTLAHALVVSIRRQHRDLAILRCLGFVRRQVLSTVVVESVVLAGLALLVGLPAGVVAGRLGWRWFADQLGIQPDVRVPLEAILLVVPVAAALAASIAVLPARRAASDDPATSLRQEGR